MLIMRAVEEALCAVCCFCLWCPSSLYGTLFSKTIHSLPDTRNPPTVPTQRHKPHTKLKAGAWFPIPFAQSSKPEYLAPSPFSKTHHRARFFASSARAPRHAPPNTPQTPHSSSLGHKPKHPHSHGRDEGKGWVAGKGGGSRGTTTPLPRHSSNR